MRTPKRARNSVLGMRRSGDDDEALFPIRAASSRREINDIPINLPATFYIVHIALFEEGAVGCIDALDFHCR